MEGGVVRGEGAGGVVRFPPVISFYKKMWEQGKIDIIDLFFVIVLRV